LLINKWNVNVETISSEGESMRDIIERQIASRTAPGSEQAPDDADDVVMRIGVFITNAVNLKGGSVGRTLLELLVDALASPRGGAALAKQFKFPFLPSEIFCRENFALIRGLYRQRPFAICFPKILLKYRACVDQNIKSNYLTALSGILEHTPPEVVLPEIEDMMPILLQAMDSPNSGVRVASVKVLQAAIRQSSSSIEDHIRSVIIRLVKMAQTTSQRGADSTVKVRLIALKCLTEIPDHLKEVLVLPYKSQVLRELEHAISDVKRHVREAAVRCRYAWFSLSTTVEDDD